MVPNCLSPRMVAVAKTSWMVVTTDGSGISCINCNIKVKSNVNSKREWEREREREREREGGREREREVAHHFVDNQHGAAARCGANTTGERGSSKNKREVVRIRNHRGHRMKGPQACAYPSIVQWLAPPRAPLAPPWVLSCFPPSFLLVSSLSQSKLAATCGPRLVVGPTRWARVRVSQWRRWRVAKKRKRKKKKNKWNVDVEERKKK